MSSNCDETTYLIYDGECPLCKRYVRMVRLKAAAGNVQLVNAREPGAAAHVIADVIARGYDLDEGMVLKQGERIAHGDDCITELALMTTPSNAFNRLNAWVFRSPARARALYPVLRAGRNALLALLGRKKINAGAVR